MSNHRRAFWVIASTAAIILLDGAIFSIAQHIPYWHGLYVITANAETFGGDVGPTSPLGYLCNLIVLIVLIPMLAAVMSLITSGFTEKHINKAHKEINEHVDNKLVEHHQAIMNHINTIKESDGKENT